MSALVPQQHLPYIENAIERFTLSGKALYLDKVAGGSVLVMDGSLGSEFFALPEMWQPPAETSSRVVWLCCFFWGVTRNGNALVVDEDEDWLYLHEVCEKKQSYPWIVRFAEGWQPPYPPAGVQGSHLPLPAECGRDELIGLLCACYGCSHEELEDLSREQLAPLINLASDIPGMGLHQRWMFLEPRHLWQRLVWGILGAPRSWRFEVQVLARPSWTYRVCDSLQEARITAWEAKREFGRLLDTSVVTSANVGAVIDRMRQFLKGCYFTIIETSPLYPLPRAWRHRRLRQWTMERHQVLYETYRGIRAPAAVTGSILVFDVTVQYDFPVALKEDTPPSFPMTLVTFLGERLTLSVRRRLSDGHVAQWTTVFVREEVHRLVPGDEDAWGIYSGE
jgi:hypothetical protein